jgi:hypothetical protein
VVAAALGLLAVGATPARAGDGYRDRFPGRFPGGFFPGRFPLGGFDAELLAQWWQWSLAFPTNADPELGTADISTDQFGEIWFLPVPLGGGTLTQSETIPAGKWLFFPVLTFELDNTGCPTNYDYTLEQLEGFLQADWDQTMATACTIDGFTVPGMKDPTNSFLLVRTWPFGYTLASSNNVLADYPGFTEYTCIPDGLTVYPAIAEGICLLLPPLKPGSHTINITATNAAFSVSYDVTFDLTVAAPPPRPRRGYE